MIEQNTVFILGAGASCPYKYLSGRELRKDICYNFRTNYKTFVLQPWQNQANLQVVGSDIDLVDEFITQFYKSSTPSIDLFLSRNPKLEDLGKKAILLSMFQSEQKSHFREELDDEKHDWYMYLFTELTRDFISSDSCEISKNKISFITFNYDRSLEHFLFESLINSFSEMTPDGIKTDLRKIPFLHMYGQIAPLPWQDKNNGISYQKQLSEFEPALLTDNIRVIYDDRSKIEDKTIVKAWELIKTAKQLFFLGFGYAKENMQLLRIPEILNHKQMIFGTAMKYTEREINGLKAIFRKKEVYTDFREIDCRAMLRECL